MRMYWFDVVAPTAIGSCRIPTLPIRLIVTLWSCQYNLCNAAAVATIAAHTFLNSVHQIECGKVIPRISAAANSQTHSKCSTSKVTTNDRNIPIRCVVPMKPPIRLHDCIDLHAFRFDEIKSKELIKNQRTNRNDTRREREKKRLKIFDFSECLNRLLRLRRHNNNKNNIHDHQSVPMHLWPMSESESVAHTQHTSDAHPKQTNILIRRFVASSNLQN